MRADEVHDAEEGARPAVRREAARVVLLDEHERLLLIEGHDPGRPALGTYLFTPGGGLEPGESTTEAALREVLEETGLRLDATDLGVVVHEETIVYAFEGVAVEQHQVFHVVRVASFEPDTSGWDAVERRTQGAVTWWSQDELRRTDLTVFPAGLLDLVLRS